jgi:hypothetical protein
MISLPGYEPRRIPAIDMGKSVGRGSSVRVGVAVSLVAVAVGVNVMLAVGVSVSVKVAVLVGGCVGVRVGLGRGVNAGRGVFVRFVGDVVRPGFLVGSGVTVAVSGTVVKSQALNTKHRASIAKAAA